MTPNYANALVQRYMRSSLKADDDSSESPGSSTSPSVGRQRSATFTAGVTAQKSSSKQSAATRSSVAPAPYLKRGSSVAKRASSLIRTAVDSSDSSDGEPHHSPKQQLPRASITARDPSRSPVVIQQILQKRISLQGASNASDSGSQLLNSSGRQTSGFTAEQGRTSSTTAMPPPAAIKEQLPAAGRHSLVDVHAADIVASYYPGYTGSPPRQSAAAAAAASGYPRTSAARHMGNSAPAGQRESRAFEFPSPLSSQEVTAGSGVSGLTRRGSASLGGWGFQQQQLQLQQGTMAASAAAHIQGTPDGRHSSIAAAGRLYPIPPSQQAPPVGALSPRSSAMAAIQQRVLQKQGRSSYSNINSLPPAVFAAVVGGTPAAEAGELAEYGGASAGSRWENDTAAAASSVSQQLRGITSTAAAAIARARSASAAAAAAAAAAAINAGDRRSSAPASAEYRSQQQQQLQEWGSPGSHSLPPPNLQLAKEAATRVTSPKPGSRVSQQYSPGRNQAAAAAAASGSDEDDDALRNIPGYGDGSRARRSVRPQQQQQLWSQEEWQQVEQQQQQHRQRSRSQSPIRRLSSTAEVTAAALDAAAGAAVHRSNSLSSADPLDLAAGVVAKRLSAFAAAHDDPQQQQQQHAAGYRGAQGSSSSPQVSTLQMHGSPMLAAIRDDDAVAANRAAKRASLIAEQAAADAAEAAAEHSTHLSRSRSNGRGSGAGGALLDQAGATEGQRVWQDVQHKSRWGLHALTGTRVE